MTIFTSHLLEAVAEQARIQGDKPALIETSGRTISYAALVNEVDRIAANLVAQGMQPGDRVLFLVRPGIDALLLLLAIVRAGGVIVAADIAMGAEVFAGRVALAAPRWVFVESLLLLVQKLLPLRRWLKRRGVEIPEIGTNAGWRRVTVGPALPGRLTLNKLRKPRSVPPDIAGRDPNAEMLIVFTSGTTDLPKGVVHSAASVDATLALIREWLQPSPDDIFYSANLHIIIPALCAGATTIIGRGRFTPQRLLADLHTYRVSKTFGIPAEYAAVADYCRTHNQTLPPTLDTLMLGAAPVLTPFLRRLAACLSSGTEVWSIYGMTEILPICAINIKEKLVYDGPGDLVGKPAPGLDVSLGDDGELLVRGPNLFQHYLGNPPVTAHPTGDIGRIDAQGNVVLLGRKKDMIIRNHYNIYPALIEPVVLAIPGVRQCALVGLYAETTADEEVVLVVEKDDPRDAGAFRRYLEAELVSGPHSIDLYAQPDRIVFMHIPLAGRSQKTNKVALRMLLRPPVAQP